MRLMAGALVVTYYILLMMDGKMVTVDSAVHG